MKNFFTLSFLIACLISSSSQVSSDILKYVYPSVSYILTKRRYAYKTIDSAVTETFLISKKED